MIKVGVAENSKTISGTIFNIQRFSVQDGPGIRTLVFLKGCPLRCQWCCNPESQNTGQDILFRKQKCIGCDRCIAACSIGAIKNGPEGKIIDRNRCTLCGECARACYTDSIEIIGEMKTVDELMDEILKDVTIYRNSEGGVTLSGGEPTSQPKFATAILKECQALGIHTAIETCGFASWNNYEMILKYTDVVLFDIKHMNPNKHKKLVEQSNELILDNFKKISQTGKKVIARVPLIPELNTSYENIQELGRFLQENRVLEIHLLPYHKLGVSKYETLDMDYKLNEVSAVSDENLNEIVFILESFGLKVTLYNH